ncbi:peptidase [Cutibacterium acnes JCM 18918]|nr:peptidase [Cutibacterium acnes JCM 18918]
MPPWRGAGRDAALGIDTTVTEATRGGSGAGMSLAKRSAQSFGGNVGVDLRGG